MSDLGSQRSGAASSLTSAVSKHFPRLKAVVMLWQAWEHQRRTHRGWPEVGTSDLLAQGWLFLACVIVPEQYEFPSPM